MAPNPDPPADLCTRSFITDDLLRLPAALNESEWLRPH